MIQTDLLGQIIQVNMPTESDPNAVQFGRVRAVYVGNEGHLRIVVLLTSGYLFDMLAHCHVAKEEGWRDKK